jgi:hypothetical protein
MYIMYSVVRGKFCSKEKIIIAIQNGVAYIVIIIIIHFRRG